MRLRSRWIWATVGIIVFSALSTWLIKEYWLGEWADAFSFGQLVVAVVLLPLVLYEFEKIRDDIKQAQKVPSLCLYHERSAGQLEKEFEVPVRNPAQFTKISSGPLNLHLVLRNHGDLVAVWYAVEVDIPPIFFSGSEPRCEPVSNSVLVKPLPNGSRRYTFNSNGQVAVYPSQQTAIFHIQLTLSASVYHQDQASFPYTIYTDQTDPVTDVLIAHFKRV